MKVINQGYEIIKPNNPTKHIERIARVCYKSEDKIGNGTDKKMVAMLYSKGHLAMFEHYRFIMQVNEMIYNIIEKVDHPFIKMTHSNDRCLISFSATSLIDMVKNSNANHHGISSMALACVQEELMYHIIKTYNCPELFGINYDYDTPLIVSTPIEFLDIDQLSDSEIRAHKWFTVKFTTDRGITHELVRHRLASFSQESTRYCNYGGDDIVFINPFVEEHVGENDNRYIDWKYACLASESVYKNLLANGCSPQYARSVLINSVKSDIIVTANIEEWDHIFSLRCDTSAHPMMRDLMIPLFNEITNLTHKDTVWKDCYNKGIERSIKWFM